MEESKDRPENIEIEAEGADGPGRAASELSGTQEPSAAPVKEAAGPAAEAPAPDGSQPDDFDVSPSDLYSEERPDYISQKKSGLKNIVLAVFAVVAIIALTWYAFRQEPRPEPEPTPTAVLEEPARPEERPAVAALPEKAPDAVDFSPTPETRAAAEVRPAPPRKSAENKATAKKADSNKSKAAENKKSETKSEASTPDQQAAGSQPSAAVESQAADENLETAPAENPTGEEQSESAPGETPTEAALLPPETTAAGAEAEAAPAEKQAAGSRPEAAPAENQAAESPAAEGAVSAISEFWVVNISSTPDAAESLPLLTKAMAADVGGQVYAYETTVEGVTRYRIRVGFFKTRSEAEAVGQKIKEDFKLSSSPWVVKPTMDEVERYRKK